VNEIQNQIDQAYGLTSGLKIPQKKISKFEQMSETEFLRVVETGDMLLMRYNKKSAIF
jgi:hypothetical protein